MKKSFYIGFAVSLTLFTGWEVYLVNYHNNYSPVMIPLFLIINVILSYITGLLACGKLKMF